MTLFSNLRTPQSEIYNTTEKGEHYLLEVDEPLVLPVDTKVRFLVTGNDVIHSWWVPELAVKKDAVPGFINETWTRTPKKVFTAASVLSCAARTTASCPLWSMWSARKSTRVVAGKQAKRARSRS